MSGTITLDAEGIEGVSKFMAALGSKIGRDVSLQVERSARKVDFTVKTSIQRGARSGRVYRRGNITHQASAPGEPPKTDTGTLVSSIEFKMETKLSATVASRLAYAYYLEFGTSRMGARPAWIPAVEKERPDFDRAIADILRTHAK